MTRTVFNEWDQPTPATRFGAARKRAAIFLWITGAALTLSMGCCSLIYGLMAVMPTNQFLDASNPQHAELIEQLDIVGPYLPYVALAVAMLGFLPGLAYLALAFGVRKGHRGQTLTCEVLLLMQCIVLGGMTALGLMGALLQGQVVGVVMVLVSLGGLLTLLIYTFTLLLRIGHPGARATVTVEDDASRDPWA